MTAVSSRLRTATARWAPEILMELRPGPLRFNALLREIDGISDRVLTERLRDLETGRFLVRLVEADRPVRVRYRLTYLGECAAELLVNLAKLEDLDLSERPALGARG